MVLKPYTTYLIFFLSFPFSLSQIKDTRDTIGICMAGGLNIAWMYFEFVFKFSETNSMFQADFKTTLATNHLLIPSKSDFFFLSRFSPRWIDFHWYSLHKTFFFDIFNKKKKKCWQTICWWQDNLVCRWQLVGNKPFVNRFILFRIRNSTICLTQMILSMMSYTLFGLINGFRGGFLIQFLLIEKKSHSNNSYLSIDNIFDLCIHRRILLNIFFGSKHWSCEENLNLFEL